MWSIMWLQIAIVTLLIKILLSYKHTWFRRTYRNIVTWKRIPSYHIRMLNPCEERMLLQVISLYFESINAFNHNLCERSFEKQIGYSLKVIYFWICITYHLLGSINTVNVYVQLLSNRLNFILYHRLLSS